MKHRYYHKRYGTHKKSAASRRNRFPRIKPGADATLEKVFAGIGTPQKRPFKPDDFQLKALAAVEAADCLVTAPTGSGKTWIAEQAIARMREKGLRAWYASPLKALTNSKYREFAHSFGPGQVGILTGDRKENPDAPIIVGTTEILRNQLYDAMHLGETPSTDFVVLDEAHYLGDEDRGVVWEETMIYLPGRIPLLMLSATIGNAHQIAAWLSGVRSRTCVVVREDRRAVPLAPLFLHPTGTLLPLIARRGKKSKAFLHKKVHAYASAKRPLLMAPPGRLPPFGDILRVLRKFRLLPAIFFLKSRSDCDHALALCKSNLPKDPHKFDSRRRRIYDLVSENPHIASHRQRKHLENYAVGAHHAGQLPAWKLVLENLMNEGFLDAIFATSTVAAGVNFPARTVLFMNTDRFNGRQFLPLDPTEFHQMTGRAGRRGMDRIGFAVALPGKFMDLPLVAKLFGSQPSDVYSRIQINFSMVLNLLLSHTPRQVEGLLARSFAAYLINKSRKRKAVRQAARDHADPLISSFRKHLSFLLENEYVTAEGRLTADGIWASQLRVDQPLLIAEGFRAGVFPASDHTLLAGITAALVSDRETRDKWDPRSIPAELMAALTTARKALRPLQAHLVSRGFETRPLSLKAAATVYWWTEGRSWEWITSAGKMEEGDLVMLILRTADNLRHIRSLKSVFPQAAETAHHAIQQMLREPVTLDY